MNWGAAVLVPKLSVAYQVCCAVLDTHHSLPGENLKNQELGKAFLLVAVLQDGEDSGMEQMHVKKLGKASPHDYCCSLNLCTPPGDAPIPSFLCLEGNFPGLLWKLFKTSLCVGKIFMNVRDFTSSSHALCRPHAGSQGEWERTNDCVLNVTSELAAYFT